MAVNKISVVQDSAGGIMATLLGIPKSVAFGMLVFAPLGIAYTPIGAAAGLVSLAMTNLIPAFFRGGGVVNSGPYSLSSLMLASVAVHLTSGLSPEKAVPLIFFTVFLSGLVQLLFGIFRFGSLAKYIPYPVIAGLMNGSGILILLSQVKPVFLAELPDLVNSPSKLFSSVSAVTIVTAAITIAAYAAVRLFRWRFLAPVVSMFFGAAAFYLLVRFSGISADKLVIGKIDVIIPLPTALNGLPGILFQPGIIRFILQLIIPASVGIALVNSLSTFLAQNESDTLLRRRTDSNSGIAGQGVANIAAAFFGGISGAGSNSRTAAAYEYGARMRQSQFAGGVFAAAAIVFSDRLLSQLPLSVLSGILIILAFSLFDGWVPVQIKEAFNETRGRRKEKLFTALVSVSVTVIMVAFGIIEAVFSGVFFSMIIFVSNMSRGIISREYTGLKMRSNTERPLVEVEILDKNGHLIRILELEGYLYFGTADRLFNRIDQIMKEHPALFILDLKRLKSIDATGIVALRQIAGRCRDEGCQLLLSSVDKNSPVGHAENTGPGLALFEQFDDCLASAEDYLIDGFSSYITSDMLKPEELDIFSGLSPDDIRILMTYMEEMKFGKGDRIVSEGEKGDSVFFILKGRADLYMNMPDGSMRRFYRLSRGAVFGEMSMIDGRPRSADVCAETDIVCIVLGIDRLDALKKDHPSIAYQILSGVAVLLSRRIRINHSIIAQLR